jgi:hypothetical protein
LSGLNLWVHNQKDSVNQHGANGLPLDCKFPRLAISTDSFVDLAISPAADEPHNFVPLLDAFLGQVTFKRHVWQTPKTFSENSGYEMMDRRDESYAFD